MKIKGRNYWIPLLGRTTTEMVFAYTDKLIKALKKIGG
jgi:hypothetical protein